MAQAGLDAEPLGVRQGATDAHQRGKLADSRAETAAARGETRQAQDDARGAASEHDRRVVAASDRLTASQDIVAALQTSRAALAVSEARQRAILASALDFAIIVTDPAGRVTDWSPGAERLPGWTALVAGQARSHAHPKHRIMTSTDVTPS